jgi:hypothetical protein
MAGKLRLSNGVEMERNGDRIPEPPNGRRSVNSPVMRSAPFYIISISYAFPFFSILFSLVKSGYLNTANFTFVPTGIFSIFILPSKFVSLK